MAHGKLLPRRSMDKFRGSKFTMICTHSWTLKERSRCFWYNGVYGHMVYAYYGLRRLFNRLANRMR